MWITVGQAAALLGLDHRTVRDQVRRGRIPATKVGRDWLIERSAVEMYRATRLGKPGRKAQP